MTGWKCPTKVLFLHSSRRTSQFLSNHLHSKSKMMLFSIGNNIIIYLSSSPKQREACMLSPPMKYGQGPLTNYSRILDKWYSSTDAHGTHVLKLLEQQKIVSKFLKKIIQLCYTNPSNLKFQEIRPPAWHCNIGESIAWLLVCIGTRGDGTWNRARHQIGIGGSNSLDKTGSMFVMCIVRMIQITKFWINNEFCAIYCNGA